MPDSPLTLWYRQPVPLDQWDHAMPLGNGRLGAMVFGGVGRERFGLNENSLWAGGPKDRNNPDAFKNLPEVRRLLFEGRPKEAMELADRTMMGRPKKIDPYQTLGELWLDFAGHAESEA